MTPRPPSSPSLPPRIAPPSSAPGSIAIDQSRIIPGGMEETEIEELGEDEESELHLLSGLTPESVHFHDESESCAGCSYYQAEMQGCRIVPSVVIAVPDRSHCSAYHSGGGEMVENSPAPAPAPAPPPAPSSTDLPPREAPIA